MEEEKRYKELAAEIAANLNPEKLQQYAEDALEHASKAYGVRDKLEKILTPHLQRVAEGLLQTDEFEEKLKASVQSQLVGVLSCATKQVCAQLMKALKEKP